MAFKFSLFFLLGPSGYPVNVRGNTISSTSIFVQWDEVPTARQNGVILYYTITYRPYSVFCLVNVFAPKTQITLTGLNESTIYWISVSASTIKGHGPARHISIATGKDSEFPFSSMTFS